MKRRRHGLKRRSGNAQTSSPLCASRRPAMRSPDDGRRREKLSRAPLSSTPTCAFPISRIESGFFATPKITQNMRKRCARLDFRNGEPHCPSRIYESTPLDGERSCFGGGIAFRDLVPVHHVPPRLEVIGTPILIFQIVGVLPHVVSHQRALAVHERRVLIGLGDERELAGPRDGHEYPSRSEDAHAGGVELVLKLVESA